jgi:thiol-disulfide isomerase/thioredoxin
MKRLFVQLLCFAPVIALAQSGFTIQGTVAAGKDPVEKVMLSYSVDGALKLDSSMVTNGSYSFKGSVKEPLLVSLRAVHRSSKRDLFQIFLENASIKVSSTDSFSQATVTGSKSDRDYRILTKSLKPYNDRMSALSAAYMGYRRDKDDAGMKRIDAQADLLQDSIRQQYKAFLNKYAQSPVAMYAFRNFAGWDIKPAEVEPIFMKLPEATRNSPAGQEMASRIQKAKLVAIGNVAPNFTQNDTLDRPVSLTSLLIDFWASWCGPCRQENPNVVAAWQKYKDKGFDVLGVSLDQPTGKERWLKAIHDDKLTWTQVSDLKYWKNEAAVAYGIQAIPQNYLLDPNGVIIGKDLRGEALQAKLAELFK